MALTTINRLLADNGVSDPKIAFPGLIALSKCINFKDVAVATSGSDSGKKIKASVNYDFIDIPEGFVLEQVLFKEKQYKDGEEKCASGTITLKTKSGEATIGSAVTVGGSTPAKEFLPAAGETKTDTVYVSTASAAWTASSGVQLVTKAGGSVVFASGETVCFVSSVDQTKGGFEVVLVGYMPDSADSRLTPERAVPWRKIGNDQRNVSNSDPLLGK